jgi:hypothetical protein
MRTYYLVIFVLVSNILFAQTVFNKNYIDTVGLGNWGSTGNIIYKESHYYLYGGYLASLDNCDAVFNRGTCFLKIDSIGNLINTSYLVNCDKDIYECTHKGLILKNNELYSCGSFVYFENMRTHYIIRINLNLSIIEINEFAVDTSSKRVFSMCNTHDDNFLVCGSIDSTYNEMHGLPDTTFTKSCLFKLSAESDILWQKSYSFGDVSDGCYSVFRHVVPAYDNGFIATGRTSDFGISKNMVLKTDSLGNQEWVRFYGNSMYRNPNFTDIIATQDSCYIVCGAYTYGEAYGGLYPYDGWLLKIDNEGQTVWDRRHRDSIYFGTTSNDYYAMYVAIAEKSNGDLIAVCRTKVDDEGYYSGSKFRIICLDSQGNRKWNKFIDSVGYQTGILNPQSIKLTDDGGIAVGGWGEFYYFNENDDWVSDQRIFLIKTDSLGNDTIVNTVTPTVSKPIDKFELVCFPNPARNEFFIDLAEDAQNDVLEIYATNGSIVHEQRVEHGNNTINICNLKSGMYLVKLKHKAQYAKLMILNE